MAFRFSDVLSLVRSHPFALCFLLLFFTPPFFPVVVYFTPLIVSTALCVLALVSIGAHFSGSPGEGGTADGVEASPTGEKIVRKVRVSKHEAPWLEWIKGCDESMRHFVEKQSAEDHDHRHLSVKEEWYTSWETNKADSGELASHALSAEEGRTVDKSHSSIAETRDEDVGGEEYNAGSSLRFSFFQKEDNAMALACPGDSNPSRVGHSSTANVDKKNTSLNPAVLVAKESSDPCSLQKSGPATEDERPLAPAPKDEGTRFEGPEE